MSAEPAQIGGGGAAGRGGLGGPALSCTGDPDGEQSARRLERALRVTQKGVAGHCQYRLETPSPGGEPAPQSWVSAQPRPSGLLQPCWPNL